MAIRSQLTQLEGQQVNDLKKLNFIALELQNYRYTDTECASAAIENVGCCWINSIQALNYCQWRQ